MALGKGFKGFMRIAPFTTTDSNNKVAPVTGFGTVIDLVNVVVSGVTFPGKDEASVEYHSNEIGGDITLRYAKNAKIFDALTNTEVLSGGTSQPKIKFKAYISPAQQQAIEDLIGRVSAVIVFLEDITETIVYEYHLVAVLSGDIEFTSENGMMKIENEFVGKPITVDSGATLTFAEYNTAVTTSNITPVIGDAVDITAIVAGDLTKLLTGNFAKIVTT